MAQPTNQQVPLLSWTLSALTAFGRFDSVWVSTDHPAIADRARNAHRGVRVFWRSPKARGGSGRGGGSTGGQFRGLPQ